MTKLDVYSEKGTKKKTGMNLPKEFEEKENLKLLAQAVRVYENRIHAGPPKTKTRGEIKASTRKIYAQKGTGRARHGAISAPIFVGGSKAHGPDGRKRTLRLPKKMGRKALSVALSIKAKEGKLLVVDGVSSLKKTKDAAKLISKLITSIKGSKKAKITFALSIDNKSTSMYLRNIRNLKIEIFSDLNAYKVYKAGILIIDKDALGKKNIKTKKKSKTIENTTNNKK